MRSDLQRLRLAVKIIAKLASKYEDKDVGEAMMKHFSARERGDATFVGTYLTDVWEINREAEEAAGYARSDARYCSAKCRQKAYRKRVTAKRADDRPRRNVPAILFNEELAVTRSALP
jgi:hypothetical protein